MYWTSDPKFRRGRIQGFPVFVSTCPLFSNQNKGQVEIADHLSCIPLFFFQFFGMGYTLLISGLYWGYKPFTNHLLPKTVNFFVCSFFE